MIIVSGSANRGWLSSFAAVHWIEAQRPTATIETTRNLCPTKILVGDLSHLLGLHTGLFWDVVQESPQSAYFLNWKALKTRERNRTSLMFTQKQ
jgi:hypothetical protein